MHTFVSSPGRVLLTLFVTFALLAGCAGTEPAKKNTQSKQNTSPSQRARSQASSEGSQDPKPFGKVVPDDAQTDEGLITTHRTADELYFEIPNSLLGREILMVSRVSKSQSDLFTYGGGGTKVNTQVLRWERRDDELLLRVASYEKTADPDDPVFQAVQNSSFEPILKSFSVEALNRDSTGVVVDAKSLFTTDVKALGLPEYYRREYQVRRLDRERSYLSGTESFPKNTDVEAVLTYQSRNPPSNPSSGTISVEMNHSMVLLPEKTMTPRLCDQRVGYFRVEHVNYSSDEQQAAEECFVTRWKLTPKDKTAYQEGKLVEPKNPITYYIDPATPEKWRPYIRRGIEDWQKAFRAAGFKNAIVAKNPSEADSTFDADDIRYSTVRWFASEVSNAQGPQVHDPRSGEILESDIGMYHDVLSLLRNWYFVQTAAVNPKARGQFFDTDVMGELLRFVVAHEVGHTLGLPHNWGSSNAVPVDSLRSPSYTDTHGTAPSIMDYARFNYVAQPGDGVTNFLPKIGPYDEWSVRWGYQWMPNSQSPEQEAQQLDDVIEARANDPRYFYGRQTIRPVDPRSQREDLGRDAVKAGSLGIANLKRIVPNLVEWTRRDGDNYDELEEIYGSVVEQWELYLGHAARHIGGVHETFKTYEQDGPVYDPVPANRQRRAMNFVVEKGFQSPEWLVETDVLRRIESTGTLNRVRETQVGILELVLQPERLARLIEIETMNAEAETYAPQEMLTDLRDGVWTELEGGKAIGTYRRNLQRGYLKRMGELMTGQATPDFPPEVVEMLRSTPVDVNQSDIQAHVRSELNTLKDEVEHALPRTTDEKTVMHLKDVLVRIENILEGKGRTTSNSSDASSSFLEGSPSSRWE